MTLKPIKMRKKVSKIKPIWDLYRDGLTQGAINRFLACREQFYLTNVLGWVPKQESEALAFGSDYHAILASYHTETTPDLDRLSDAYYGQVKRRMGRLTAQNHEDLTLRQATVETTIRYYLKFWEKEDSKREWLLREETFQERHYGMFPDTIPLRGRFDGVFEKSGLWLLETKTKGQIDEDGIQASLSQDVQTMLYCYCLWKRTGVYPAGIVYDVVRRPGLRRKDSESFADFQTRISKDMQDRPDHYFKRWKVELLKKDLQLWQDRFLVPVLTQIRDWWHDTNYGLSPWQTRAHFRNPNALFSRYGKCDLFYALTNNDFRGLKRLKKPYPELED